MPEIPEEALQAAAEALSGHSDLPPDSWQTEARIALEAAAPILRADERRKTAERDRVTVSADDLDIVLNRGDKAVGWQRYSEACNRLRAALPDRTAT